MILPGCRISQFELHLRALLDLPTPILSISAPSLMVNLIGTPLHPQWLNIPLVKYIGMAKKYARGRKVGHINLSHPDKTVMAQSLSQLRQFLPEDYQSGRNGH